MSNSVTIKGITCYGTFEEDSNVMVVGTFANGTELEEIWCNDTLETNWTGAVRELKEWADREGHEIDELSAC
jgi:hypothetical protein